MLGKKIKAVSTLLLTISCLLFSNLPAFAGEWQQDKDDNWQYLQDDGEYALGRVEIDDEYYYFDDDGNRKEDYWLKEDGSWYYFDEDGVMATSTWVDNYYVNSKGRMTRKR